MAVTDICMKEIEVSFLDERFRTPFKLSSGEISEITYASVNIKVENRRGEVAEGIGGVLLSDLWSFPAPNISHLDKDRIMRGIVSKIAGVLSRMEGYYDPLQIAHSVDGMLPRLLQEMRQESLIEVGIPRLAGLVCWSPFDAALHDSWGKAAGMNTYQMYTSDYLNDDLGHYLGAEWRGSYPGEFLIRPKERLWVQHVIGVSDPLTPFEARAVDVPDDDLPVSLEDWIEEEKVRWFKLKVKGADVNWDLQRIVNVYRVAAKCARANGIKQPVRYEIDPNEGCADPEPMIELLRKLRETDLAAYEALVYIEQPTSRNLAEYHFTLHEISKFKPVLVDESLEDLDHLQHIERLGWSGVALKTCKGQSHALITYCWAKRKGLFISLQDLTNPGYSLVQSANLCSYLDLSSDGFEYNSRQYIPFSRLMEQKQYPKLFTVRQGRIDLSQLSNIGLY